MAQEPDLTGFGSTGSGLYYKIHTANKGKKARASDYISMHLIHKSGGDTIVFSTYDANHEPIKFRLTTPAYNGDIMEGLMMMRAGDSATFYVPSDSIYRNGFMPSFTYEGGWMKYEVKVEDIQKEKEHEKQLEENYERQLTEDFKIIHNYIQSENLKDIQRTTNGVYYVIHSHGNYKKGEVGNTVTVHYQGRLVDGREFDSSFKRNEPYSIVLGQNKVIKGWEDVLLHLSEGDSATVIIPSGMAYGERAAGAIPANSVLIFDLKVEDIQTPEARDKGDHEAIEAYLESKNISAQKTREGVYYSISEKGKGKHLKKGDQVKIHYTGMLLDGTVFDSSKEKKPLEVEIGAGRVILGWELALQHFKRGGKGMIFVPAALAYGERGSPPKIPANAVLVFELEVVK